MEAPSSGAIVTPRAIACFCIRGQRCRNAIDCLTTHSRAAELRRGWICPGCRTAHSPDVMRCDCEGAA